jgi:hypothetical protein
MENDRRGQICSLTYELLWPVSLLSRWYRKCHWCDCLMWKFRWGGCGRMSSSKAQIFNKWIRKDKEIPCDFCVSVEFGWLIFHWKSYGNLEIDGLRLRELTAVSRFWDWCGSSWKNKIRKDGDRLNLDENQQNKSLFQEMFIRKTRMVGKLFGRSVRYLAIEYLQSQS